MTCKNLWFLKCTTEMFLNFSVAKLKATHVSELHQAQFSQFTDTVVG